MSQTPLCIYCGQPGGSKEHLMPRALGGALTAEFLCRTCNTELGKLYDYLAKDSLVALARITHTQTFEVKLGHLRFIDWEGYSKVGFHLINQGKAKLVPQLHLVEESSQISATFLGSEPDLDTFRDIINREIKRDFKDTRIRVDPEWNHIGVFNDEGKKLLIRGPQSKSLEDVKALLRTKLGQMLPKSSGQKEIRATPPVMKVSHKIDGRLQQAIATIALHMMAYKWGPEVVRGVSFDSARTYVKNGIPNDQVQVQELESGDTPIPDSTEGYHEVIFHPQNGAVAEVRLYQSFRWLVSFRDAVLPPEFQSQPLSSHSFSGERDGVYDQKGSRSAEHLLERFGPPDLD